MERMRQEAAAAFHWLDSHERLRAALNSRSRPPHLKADALAPGTVVLLQTGRPESASSRLCCWLSRVACADGPDRLWLRFKGSVVRVALEDVRLATSEEEMGPSFILDAMNSLEEEFTGHRRPPGYEDEEEEAHIDSEAGALGSGDLISGAASKGQILSPPEKYTFYRGSKCKLQLFPQMQNYTDGMEGNPKGEVPTTEPPVPAPQVPVPTPEIIELAKSSADRCRALDGLPRKFRAGAYEPVQPQPSTVPEKIAFFEQGGQEEWKSILSEAQQLKQGPSGLHRLAAEKDIQELQTAIRAGLQESARQRDFDGEPMLKTPRIEDSGPLPSEPGVSSLAPMVTEAKFALEAWALSSTSSSEESQRMKEMIEEFDQQQLELERGHRAGLEPGARGEIYLRDMTPTEVRLTTPVLIKALDIHFQYAAVEAVPLDTPVAKEATLQSRFVIVNKKWLQRLFGPKGRLCVGGH